MPQWYSTWYCSLTVLSWILNYFFSTSFWAKDNRDVFALAQSGRRNSQLLELDTTALFLDRLYLDVTIFTSMTKEEYEITLKSSNIDEIIEIYKKYIKPQYHSCIQWNKFVFEDGNSIEVVDLLIRKRIANSTLKFEYDCKRQSIVDWVKNNQNIEEWWVLFLLWLNRHILYDETPKSDLDNWGHVVVATWIDQNNNFIIYEPISPRPNPHLIPVEKVLDAIWDWDGYNMVMIKDNPDHQ